MPNAQIIPGLGRCLLPASAALEDDVQYLLRHTTTPVYILEKRSPLSAFSAICPNLIMIYVEAAKPTSLL